MPKAEENYVYSLHCLVAMNNVKWIGIPNNQNLHLPFSSEPSSQSSSPSFTHLFGIHLSYPPLQSNSDGPHALSSPETIE